MKEPGPLQRLSYEFGLHIINCHQSLTKLREYVLAKQLLKSGTSIGANIHEAIYAQSTDDYISKFSIALKEASETKFWLRLLIGSNIVRKEAELLHEEVDHILRILASSIKTLKAK